jgi:hypothetical protein
VHAENGETIPIILPKQPNHPRLSVAQNLLLESTDNPLASFALSLGNPGERKPDRIAEKMDRIQDTGNLGRLVDSYPCLEASSMLNFC